MKNVQNQTEIVQGGKKCASLAHYGIEWPCMALCGLKWPFTAFLSYMASFGLTWS